MGAFIHIQHIRLSKQPDGVSPCGTGQLELNFTPQSRGPFRFFPVPESLSLISFVSLSLKPENKDAQKPTFKPFTPIILLLNKNVFFDENKTLFFCRF